MYVTTAGVTDNTYNQLGVLIQCVPSSTSFTFWQGPGSLAVNSSSGGQVTDGPAAAGATTCTFTYTDPTTGADTCYFYPSVFMAGHPRGGNGWLIPFMTSVHTVGSVTFPNWVSGQVHAYILGCNTNNANINRCDNPADNLHDTASPPWTAIQVNHTSGYSVACNPSMGSCTNPTGYPSTAVVGIFNAPSSAAGFNTISANATFFFSDPVNCPTITSTNFPSGSSNNDCIVYQTNPIVSNNTPTCSNTYTGNPPQTFHVCATMGLFATQQGTSTYNACKAGGDFSASIRNITYRYNRAMHGVQGLVPTAVLSSCGDPNAGLHFMSIHDYIADDLDPWTYGVNDGNAAANGKSGQGIFASNSTPAHQLYTCTTDVVGNYVCTNTTVTHCSFSSGTATITLSQDPDIVAGQSVTISGMSAGFTGYNSVDQNNGTVITGASGSAPFTLSYAATGLSSGTCSGNVFYTSSANDFLINHVTVLPVISNVVDNRALKHPLGTSPTPTTAGFGGFNIGISAPLASMTNLTYTNNISYGGVQSVPSASNYPNQCGVNTQNSINTLNCIVGASFAATPSWCYNNNIITSGSISNDPYQPGVQKYPDNGLYAPLPGDSGFPSQPAAGTCPNAPASTIETQTFYDLIGFTNHAFVGTCYPLRPGTPDFYVKADPNCNPAPGVPNYKLNSSSPFINAGLKWVAGAVSGTTCNSFGCWVPESKTATAWSISGNVITVTAANHGFSANQQVYLSGFPSAPFNGQLFTVNSAGLTTNVFKVNFTFAGSQNASEVGCASLTGFCDIGANVDIVNQKIIGVYQ
jgi:hypothetical protein